MSNKFKALSLAVVYATSLTLGLSTNSFAGCDDEIQATVSDVNMFEGLNGDEAFFAGGFISMATTVYVPMGLVSAGAAAVSTTIDKVTELSDNERYAYSVLSKSRANNDAALSSFIKLTKKEIAKDRNAVIPSDEEIVRSIAYVNDSLLACRNEKEKFFKPTKETLVKAVIKDLKVN